MSINQPNQPVVRVTWNEAMAFCKWLSQKTGKKFTLPTEAQWEWACRAGTDSPFFYGNRDTDFAKFANLADASLNQLDRGDAPPWHPRDRRFNDGSGVTADVGRYRAECLGPAQHASATPPSGRSAPIGPIPMPTPTAATIRNPADMKTVRGGSWFDRPIHAALRGAPALSSVAGGLQRRLPRGDVRRRLGQRHRHWRGPNPRLGFRTVIS